MNNHIFTSIQQPIKDGQRQRVVRFVILAGFCNSNEVKGVDVHFRFSGCLTLVLFLLISASQRLSTDLARVVSQGNSSWGKGL